MARCCPCIRGDRRVLQTNEIHVPEQCPDLWSAIQRSIGARGRGTAKTVIRVAEGDWDLGKRPPLLIDCDGIRIVGSGIDVTRLVRFDQMPKLQVSGGAANVVLESLSVGGESTGDGIAVLGSAILKMVDVGVALGLGDPADGTLGAYIFLFHGLEPACWTIFTDSVGRHFAFGADWAKRRSGYFSAAPHRTLMTIQLSRVIGKLADFATLALCHALFVAI